MKKLMTVIAAVATGLSALTGTAAASAGSLPENVFDATKVTAVTDEYVDTVWTNGWDGADVITNSEKAVLQGEGDAQVLHIETGNTPLSRLVKGDGSKFTATDKVYFDVEANLLGQVLDDVPLSTLPETAKFALFLLDGSLVEGAPNETNLFAIVRDPSDAAKKALVKLSTSAEQLAALLSGKARVTIQGYKNVLAESQESECMGFRVYLGGEIAGSGEEQAYVDPLQVSALYAITDNVVSWSNVFNGSTYLEGMVTSTFGSSTARKSLLLSCIDGNAELEKFDFVGNADISMVTINDTGFDFIPSELSQAKVTLDGVEITVDPEDAYDSENGILTKSCTITASIPAGSSKSVIKVMAGEDYLESTGVDNQWKYSFAANCDISFKAFAVAVTIVVTDGETSTTNEYSSMADALETIGNLTGTATISLGQPVALGTSLVLGGEDITLDLNGQTISAASMEDYSDFGEYVIAVASGKLTITDSSSSKDGRIVAPTTDVAAVFINNGATIDIQAGIYDGQVKESTEEGDSVNTTIRDGLFRKAENTSDIEDEQYQKIGEQFALIGTVEDGKTAQLVTNKVDDVDVEYWQIVDGEPVATTYTVTFVTAYGTKPDDQTVEENGHAQKPEGTLTADDYVFAYWYGEDESTAFDFEKTAITSNITLTAKWEAKGWADYLGAADENDYYVIDDEAEFKAFAEHAQTLGTAGLKFALGGDIALTVTDAGTANTDGIGIQNFKDSLASQVETFKSKAFGGEFDGRGHTISNVILPCTDYAGLFMATYGATIKNLKVSLGNATGFATPANSSVEYGGGVIAGVVMDTTIENCSTVVADSYNALQAPKGLAGIVGFAEGGTVLVGCTNNLNIVTSNQKAGGLVACSSIMLWDGSYGLTIQDCANFGNVTSSATGNTDKGVPAGIVPYVGTSENHVLTIKGTCVLNGTVTGTDGVACSIAYPYSGSKVVVEDGAVIMTTQTSQQPLYGATCDGLNFAKVEDGVATFVKNAAAQANGASTKVMVSGQTLTLSTENDSITLDQSMATATVSMASTLSADDYEITETVVGDASAKVTTYTLVKKAATTIDVVPGAVEATTYESSDAATVEVNKINAAIENGTANIVVPTELTDSTAVANYKKLFAAKAVANADGTSYSVKIDFTDQATTDLQTQVDDDVKIVELQTLATLDTDAEQAATITTTPGLYYTVYAGTDVTALNPATCKMATGTTLEIKFPNKGTRGFYKVGVSITTTLLQNQQ